MSDLIYYKNGEETFRISPPTVETKCPKTKLEVKKMTEIEKTEGEIKVLQAKLELLKEMENYKSPVEEAYKRVYGNYPTGEHSWIVFKKGYEEAQKDYKVGDYQPTPQERGDQIHNEVEKLQEKNWYVDAKTLLKSNWEPKPQTPEQVADGLRDAMRQAKKDGVFDAVDEPPEYDEVEWDISETAPPKPAVSLYARLDDGFLYSRSGICKKVRDFLLDEGVIEYDDEECITFTLHKSLLDAPND